jgi:hypothetical protein
VENIAANQMHHSRHVALLHYGRQPIHFPNMAPTQQDAMALFSLEFHRFFMVNAEAFTSWHQTLLGNDVPMHIAYAPTIPVNAKALHYGKGLEEAEATQLVDLQQYLGLPFKAPTMEISHPRAHRPLLWVLREFLGLISTEWKAPYQETALYYLLKGTPNLTIILLTGSGKSTLFLLAAAVQ